VCEYAHRAMILQGCVTGWLCGTDTHTECEILTCCLRGKLFGTPPRCPAPLPPVCVLCVCVNVCMRVCQCVCVSMSVCECVCICVHIYTCGNVCVFACAYACVCMRECLPHKQTTQQPPTTTSPPTHPPSCACISLQGGRPPPCDAPKPRPPCA